MKTMRWFYPVGMLAVIWICAGSAWALWGMGEDKKKEDSTKNSANLPGMEGTSAGQGASGLPGFSDKSSSAAPKASAATATSNPSSGATQSAAAASSASAPFAESNTGSNLPTEVVIKGTDSGQKLGSQKPPLRVEVDSFESIRDSLSPDTSLLLAESPHTITWRHTYPDFLYNTRIVQPWRTTFSERSGIVFNIHNHLQEAIGRPLDPKEVKNFQWSLTIADEEGRVFQRYEGTKDPPEELVWTGQNDQGEWIKAGRSYSAVYMFTDPNGSPHTKVGKPVQFTGMMHQESDGLHISLDSSVLFGASKIGQDIDKAGNGLLRAAADLIKRRFNGVPIRVQIYSSTKDLAETQANKVAEFLRTELMLQPQNLSTDTNHASFSDQRIEIVLLNR